MNDIAIRVEHLSKEYRIGRLRPGLTTLRETLTDALRSPFRRRRPPGGTGSGGAHSRDDRIWALKDVSFEVKHGEVTGIIGGNGAGKSTLLKIVSRITEPTLGAVSIHGRVGSLLEVGTGFHADLTGRENVYLNGAIIGMRRREIAARFDEIVAFAEIEQFIDTPVKYYSTGMYLRLAFAVAAHLESDILIVDEVLAVGDQAFQAKCLAKIEALSRTGRTVFFVSHNMATVERLCTRCLLFRRGQLVAEGAPPDIVAQYHEAVVDLTGHSDLRSHPGRSKDSVPIMTDVTLLNEAGEATACLRMGSGLAIRVTFDDMPSPIRPNLGIVVKTALGVPVFGTNYRTVSRTHPPRAISRGTIVCRFENLPLMPGRYLVDLQCGDWDRHVDLVQDAISFEVVPGDVFGTGMLPARTSGSIFWPAAFDVHDGGDAEP
jgi:lipopolysaccharide transport system ATP-binding protein